MLCYSFVLMVLCLDISVLSRVSDDRQYCHYNCYHNFVIADLQTADEGLLFCL